MAPSDDVLAHGPFHLVAASFAAWMAGSAAGGAELLQRAELLPAADLPSQIAAIMRLFGRHNDEVADLDALLRSDPTTLLDLHHPLIRGDVRRLHVLQRELQRACLTATLGRLAPQRRAAFILREILRLSKEQAAACLEKTVSALEVAYGRAVRELEAYLGPRCEHADPDNMCHCSTRLAIAVDRGFVSYPDRDDLPGDAPLTASRRRDAYQLYAALPPPR